MSDEALASGDMVQCGRTQVRVEWEAERALRDVHKAFHEIRNLLVVRLDAITAGESMQSPANLVDSPFIFPKL